LKIINSDYMEMALSQCSSFEPIRKPALPLFRACIRFKSFFTVSKRTVTASHDSGTRQCATSSPVTKTSFFDRSLALINDALFPYLL